MLHVSGHLNTNGDFWRLVQGIVRPALWCFLMLSGYFILSRPIDKMGEFYFKHILHLLIPLVFYTFCYQIYYSGVKGILFKPIMAGDSIGHLWFVYSLIVLYILAPFLQKMLFNINNIQLTGLLIVIFFCGRIINIMTALGWGIGIPTNIIGDCSLFFFIFGYWIYRININISYKIYIPLGIINIIYCAYTFSNPVLADGGVALSLSMVVGVLFYYLLFREINITDDGILPHIITYISSRTYGIYLIHILIFNIFTNNAFMVLEPYSYTHFWMLPLKCIVIFSIGLILATFMDLLICDPIFKACKLLIKKVALKIYK